MLVRFWPGHFFSQAKKRKKFLVGFHHIYVPDQAFQSTHISFLPRNGATQCTHMALVSFPDPEMSMEKVKQSVKKGSKQEFFAVSTVENIFSPPQCNNLN